MELHPIYQIFQKLLACPSVDTVSRSTAFQPQPEAMGREAGRHTASKTLGLTPRRVVAVACRGIADNPEAVSSHRASNAADLMFLIKKLACYWPIPILPVGQVHARGCWLILEVSLNFLEGTEGGIFQPSPTIKRSRVSLEYLESQQC